MSWLPFLFFLGAAQGLFLALMLFNAGKGNRHANRYLAAYLGLLAVELFEAGLLFIGALQSSPTVRILIAPYAYAQGPVLYMYCRQLTQPGRPMPFVSRVATWLLPVVHVCLMWPQLWLKPDIQSAMLGTGDGLTPFFALWRSLLYETEDMLFAGHFFLFLMLSLGLLVKHQRVIRETQSSLLHTSLDWLKLILLATVAVYLAWFLQMLFMEPSSVVSQRLDLAKGLTLVALTYTLGWLGYRQPGIFAESPAAQAPSSDSEPVSDVVTEMGRRPTGKYERSALSSELAAALFAEAEQLMQSESLFLQPTLSLHELAERMSVSTNYLSQAINQQGQLSFFDFVNRYRVNYAADRLADPAKTILQSGLDAGFNSKSAFYTAFRKHLGMTPGAYRKQSNLPPVA